MTQSDEGLTAMGSLTKVEVTDTQGSGPANEVQVATLNNATGGTFRLAFSGQTTKPIDYNASTSTVETALEELNAVDNVTVTGNAGGPWTVTFSGTHANVKVSAMTGDAATALSGSTLRTISYTWDAADQLTAASDADSAYAYSYDNLGRVLTVDNNNTPGVPRVILTSAYDANSNRTSLSATNAGTNDFLNSYTFDNLNRLTRLDQTGNGGATVAEKRVDFAYNALGQFTTIARYKDTDGGSTHEVATANYSYDTLNRLTGLSYQKGGSNLFTPYAWTYDGLSRVTQLTSQDGTSAYTYDATSQLTAVDHSYQTDESYSFDDNGNRTMSGYTTGTNNRLTSDGVYNYTYDDEGNRTRRTAISGGAYEDYEWDYRNRLTKVTFKTSGGTTTKVVAYTYDLFDRRIGRAVDTTSAYDLADAAIERYVYDGLDVVMDFVDPDGTGGTAIGLKTRYLHGPAVDQVLAQETASTNAVLWHLADDLGTVRDLVDNTGAVVTHYKYEAFGKVTSGDTSKTRYLFTGREYDTDTTLQYNWHRWYDSRVGRWISEDPIGFLASDANLSRYVGNSAPMFIDPSGFFQQPDPSSREQWPWNPDRDFPIFDTDHGTLSGLPPFSVLDMLGHYEDVNSVFPIPDLMGSPLGPPLSLELPGGVIVHNPRHPLFIDAVGGDIAWSVLKQKATMTPQEIEDFNWGGFVADAAKESIYDNLDPEFEDSAVKDLFDNIRDLIGPFTFFLAIPLLLFEDLQADILDHLREERPGIYDLLPETIPAPVPSLTIQFPDLNLAATFNPSIDFTIDGMQPVFSPSVGIATPDRTFTLDFGTTIGERGDAITPFVRVYFTKQF